MKIRAKYRGFNFPYLYDGDTQAVALKYGPTATPHVFIFDQQPVLRYEGRIDSNPRQQLATKHEARDAIEALLAGMYGPPPDCKGKVADEGKSASMYPACLWRVCSPGHDEIRRVPVLRNPSAV